MSSNTIISVIIASAQSVCKIFLIGAAGVFAVKYPRKNTLLPPEAVGILARFSFHILLLPLIYSTTASSVTPYSIPNYWFVIVGSFFVFLISYFVATVLNYYSPFHILKIKNKKDFIALRIAATFPNIVALPILIFPSLCEYPIVHNSYITTSTASTTGTSLPLYEDDFPQEEIEEDYDAAIGILDHDSDKMNECIALSTTLIFCYFFSWSLAFWIFGNRQLMGAAIMAATPIIDDNDDNNDHQKQQQQSNNSHESLSIMEEISLSEIDEESKNNTLLVEETLDSQKEKKNEVTEMVSASKNNDMDNNTELDTTPNEKNEQRQQQCNKDNAKNKKKFYQSSLSFCKHYLLEPIYQTVTSVGFLALLFGFITGCIPPLQNALFATGGTLRFIGSAIETLGIASSPISTVVVAASLFSPSSSLDNQKKKEEEEDDICSDNENNAENENNNHNCYKNEENSIHTTHDNDPHYTHGSITNSDNNNNNENLIMSDPSYGPHIKERSLSFRKFLNQQSSTTMIPSLLLLSQQPRSRPQNQNKYTTSLIKDDGRKSEHEQKNKKRRSLIEIRRMLVWFVLSRLVISPAIVVLMIVAMDCSSNPILSAIPNLSKLVLIINSSMPGAQTIIVLLKCNGESMADTATAVAKIYLPSYLLSIFTIAAWTAIGLYVTLPNDDGLTICERL